MSIVGFVWFAGGNEGPHGRTCTGCATWPYFLKDVPRPASACMCYFGGVVDCPTLGAFEFQDGAHSLRKEKTQSSPALSRCGCLGGGSCGEAFCAGRWGGASGEL